MSVHQNAPAGTPGARHVHSEKEGAEVLEIYPGAAAADPRARKRRKLIGSEAGMATAEYAIATLAAVGFAGILVFIMRSDEVRGFLLNLIRTALALP